MFEAERVVVREAGEGREGQTETRKPKIPARKILEMILDLATLRLKVKATTANAVAASPATLVSTQELSATLQTVCVVFGENQNYMHYNHLIQKLYNVHCTF